MILPFKNDEFWQGGVQELRNLSFAAPVGEHAYPHRNLEGKSIADVVLAWVPRVLAKRLCPRGALRTVMGKRVAQARRGDRGTGMFPHGHLRPASGARVRDVATRKQAKRRRRTTMIYDASISSCDSSIMMSIVSSFYSSCG